MTKNYAGTSLPGLEIGGYEEISRDTISFAVKVYGSFSYHRILRRPAAAPRGCLPIVDKSAAGLTIPQGYRGILRESLYIVEDRRPWLRTVEPDSNRRPYVPWFIEATHRDDKDVVIARK
jgi:hypothetical protein